MCDSFAMAFVGGCVVGACKPGQWKVCADARADLGSTGPRHRGAVRRCAQHQPCMTVINGRDFGDKTLAPVGNFVLIELEKRKNVSSGGIVLSGAVKTKRRTGHVLAADDGSKFALSGTPMPMDFKIGDRVIFSSLGDYRGTQVKIDGKDCIILSASDILGTAPDEEAGLTDVNNLQPAADKLVVFVDKLSESTVGGILLSSNVKRTSRTGVVVNVGPGKLLEDGSREPIGVQVGDRIMWQEYAGNEVDTGKAGDKYFVIRGGDVLATF
ncbi:20 kDa chaperonin, chloroplastic [Porphyridium purpureum]|uniref:20 kDa chaperonin, chloroplastic n=1 Tax=Porphyridium purpureum TaxID=35688 RepID=A0A5J4YXW7_PORPP|nr:20 kDa chaperonin, chloroplastic [Porphyridium purpureum]|eukprot:POR3873..scf209_3